MSPVLRVAGSVTGGLARQIVRLFLAPPPNEADVPARMYLYSTLDRRDSEKAA
jgi:hypothetical protein